MHGCPRGPHAFMFRSYSSSHPPFASCTYGIGGLGSGGTPQIADAQGGSGGVGIRDELPCVAAVAPLMQVPVKVALLGYGVVNPALRVCRKATMWFSS